MLYLGFFAAVYAIWIALLLLWRLVRKQKLKPSRRRRFAIQFIAILVHLLITTPLVLACFITFGIGTRGDERGYSGPRFDDQARWKPQAPLSNPSAKNPSLGEGGPVYDVGITLNDGARVRAFWVPHPEAKDSHSTAICTHGLFRNALEVDRIGCEFYELGLSVLLLEWRNHGGSDRQRFRAGQDTFEEILAAAAFVHGQPHHQEDDLYLYGISLGTVAVLRAAYQVPRIKGVAVEAPLTAIGETARRMMTAKPEGEGAIVLYPPFRQLVLLAWETIAGFSLDDVETESALKKLPPSMRVLFVAGGRDKRVPKEAVSMLFETLPQPIQNKRLWISEESSHGHVYNAHPVDYSKQLKWLVQKE
jgi:pimeloyl-ACP methyl ester carboxylesterase